MRPASKIVAATAGVGLVAAGAIALPRLASADEQVSVAATPTASSTASPDSSSSTDSGAGARQGRMGGLQSSLDALVADGTITKAQADAIVKRLQADRPARDGDQSRGMRGGPGMNRMGGMDGMGGMGKGRHAGGGAMLTAAAKALGLSEDALRTQLQTKSLAQVAQDQGVSRETLKKALTDAMTAQASERIDTMLDRVPGERPRPGQSGTTGKTATPSTSPTT